MNNSIGIGSEISLLSKSDIRYEGILYTLDTKENTIWLAKVKSFGTEQRNVSRKVPPRDEIYEYVVFRGSDIKDYHVKNGQQSPPVLPSGLPNDPAIIQVFHSMTPCNYGQNFGPMCAMSFQHLQNQMAAYNVPPLYTNHPSSNRSGTFQTSQRKNTIDASVQVSDLEKSETKDHRGQTTESIRTVTDSAPMRPFNRGYNPNRRFQGGRGIRRGGGGRRRGSFIRNPEPLRFDSEYDFELANAEFAELENKLSKKKLTETDAPTETGAVTETDVPANDTDEDSAGYDRTKSFFDNISCEASRTTKGIPRFDWRVEKKLNVETFGVPVSTNWLRRRRGRGGYRRGGRGRSVSTTFNKTNEVAKAVSFVEQVVTAEIERPETPSEITKTTDDIPIIEMVAPKVVWEDNSEANKEQWK